MFQVGDKVRINSIPHVVSIEAVKHFRKMSLEAFKEAPLEELQIAGFDPIFVERRVVIYNLITQVQTISKIYPFNYVDILGCDTFYIEYNDMEKVEEIKEKKEPVKSNQRISIKALRQILCSK